MYIKSYQCDSPDEIVQEINKEWNKGYKVVSISYAENPKKEKSSRAIVVYEPIVGF